MIKACYIEGDGDKCRIRTEIHGDQDKCELIQLQYEFAALLHAWGSWMEKQTGTSWQVHLWNQMQVVLGEDMEPDEVSEVAAATAKNEFYNANVVNIKNVGVMNL